MKVIKPSKSNIVFVGIHPQGKPHLERLYFEGGTISRRGDIGNKSTVSDFMILNI
jgi:hypothetical protein